MSADLLSNRDSESGKLLCKGDRVRVDNLKGRVEEVCPPNSPISRDFSCDDTGGVLIQFDDGVLALLPFGTHHRIVIDAPGVSG